MASASSIKIKVPFGVDWHQEKSLSISGTAYSPSFSMSPPEMMAKCKPELYANNLANRVFPVPGYPWNRKLRKGAL